MKTQIQTLALPLKSYKTYLWATAFVIGNLLFPQLLHSVGFGGKILLPILFFTLIAASRFGLACGLLTAVASPLINNLLFGMPTAEMLAVIVIKSVVLAVIIGLAVQKNGTLTLAAGVLAIVLYQLIGMLFFALFTHSLSAAWADVAMSWPGMALQMIAVLVLTQLPVKKEA